jgi:hypothetical protein
MTLNCDAVELLVDFPSFLTSKNQNVDGVFENETVEVDDDLRTK